jgi:hypothetical protein
VGSRVLQAAGVPCNRLEADGFHKVAEPCLEAVSISIAKGATTGLPLPNASSAQRGRFGVNGKPDGTGEELRP